MATVDLSWTDNSANEDGFRVYRSTTPSPTFPDDYSQIDSLAADTTAYDDASPPEGTDLTYAVTAFNDAGESSETTASVTTPQQIGTVRIRAGGATYNVPVYDPSTLSGATWLRTNVGGTVGALRLISAGDSPLHARHPSKGVVSVESNQI